MRLLGFLESGIFFIGFSHHANLGPSTLPGLRLEATWSQPGLSWGQKVALRGGPRVEYLGILPQCLPPLPTASPLLPSPPFSHASPLVPILPFPTLTSPLHLSPPLHCTPHPPPLPLSPLPKSGPET